MRFQDVMLSGMERRSESVDERRRQQAIEETRIAAKYGSPNLPLAVVSDESLTDTFIGQLIDLHNAVRAEYEQEQDK